MPCIPKGARVFIVRHREEIPLFKSPIFFLYLFIGIIKYRKLKFAIIFAIIKYLKPRVIITFIDNAISIGKIKKIFRSIPIIAIQNGTRWDFSNRDQPKINYDHYFAFGFVEAEIFFQGDHSVESYYPIGSLRAGLFRDENPVSIQKKFDLCYVSQLDPIPLNLHELDKWTIEIFSSYYDLGKQYFNMIAKFAEENNLSLCVAMRSPQNNAAFAREREYYDYQGYERIEYVPQSTFSSYKAVQASRLTLTISSTLGYEALGWGGKVIFAKDIQSVRSLIFQGSWSVNYATHKLPELQRLLRLDYSELSFKVAKLLAMEDNEYLSYSKIAREYYMNYEDANKPHLIIMEKIIGLME